MAQPASNPKIEELRGRLKADPKSRLFFPLAEELRKVSQLTEAEQVLLGGLGTHPTYLSAWVSLGRVQRELGKNDEAVESLTKALQIDPGNVVAARILADAYLALGEKVEAIKKYKLVHALLPSDEELEAVIERLELELHPPAPVPVSEEPPQFESIAMPEPAPEQPAVSDEMPWTSEPEPDVFAQAEAEVEHQQEVEQETGDSEPMAAAHAESPFEEPAADFGYTADAFSIEQPDAMHVEPAPVSAELAADVFEPATDEPMPFPMTAELPAPASDDFSKTLTMADLYAKQGLVDEARDIYEDILMRDPNNDAVRAKMDALSHPSPSFGEEERGPELVEAPDEGALPQARIARLENWLAKVARRESGRI